MPTGRAWSNGDNLSPDLPLSNPTVTIGTFQLSSNALALVFTVNNPYDNPIARSLAVTGAVAAGFELVRDEAVGLAGLLDHYPFAIVGVNSGLVTPGITAWLGGYSGGFPSLDPDWYSPAERRGNGFSIGWYGAEVPAGSARRFSLIVRFGYPSTSDPLSISLSEPAPVGAVQPSAVLDFAGSVAGPGDLRVLRVVNGDVAAAQFVGAPLATGDAFASQLPLSAELGGPLTVDFYAVAEDGRVSSAASFATVVLRATPDPTGSPGPTDSPANTGTSAPPPGTSTPLPQPLGALPMALDPARPPRLWGELGADHFVSPTQDGLQAYYRCQDGSTGQVSDLVTDVPSASVRVRYTAVPIGPIAVVAMRVENYGTVSQGLSLSVYAPTAYFSVVSGGVPEWIQTGADILDFPTSERTGFYLRHEQFRFNVRCRGHPLADDAGAYWYGDQGHDWDRQVADTARIGALWSSFEVYWACTVAPGGQADRRRDGR
jgi:hypothetical protein